MKSFIQFSLASVAVLCLVCVSLQAQNMKIHRLGERTNAASTDVFPVDVQISPGVWTNYQMSMQTVSNYVIGVYTNLGNQVWTNDGTYVWLVGQPQPTTTSPGPSMFIRKDGSMFFGTNANQDVDLADYTKWQFQRFSMTDSNEPFDGIVYFGSGDSEEYNDYAYSYLHWDNISYPKIEHQLKAQSSFGADVGGLAAFGVNAGNVNGGTGPYFEMVKTSNTFTMNLHGGNLLDYVKDGTNVFGVGVDGNLAKVRGINYQWPTTTNYGVLTNDGTGVLSWTTNISGIQTNFDYFYSTNLFVVYFYSQWAFITNLYSDYSYLTNSYTSNLYAYNIIVTNQVRYSTNSWAGPTNDVNISGPYDLNYTTMTPVEITGFTNKPSTTTAEVLLSIYNASGSNVTMTYPLGLVDGNYVTSQTISNETVGCFWLRYTPVWPRTNSVFRGL